MEIQDFRDFPENVYLFPGDDGLQRPRERRMMIRTRSQGVAASFRDAYASLRYPSVVFESEWTTFIFQ